MTITKLYNLIDRVEKNTRFLGGTTPFMVFYLFGIFILKIFSILSVSKAIPVFCYSFYTVNY